MLGKSACTYLSEFRHEHSTVCFEMPCFTGLQKQVCQLVFVASCVFLAYTIEKLTAKASVYTSGTPTVIDIIILCFWSSRCTYHSWNRLCSHPRCPSSLLKSAKANFEVCFWPKKTPLSRKYFPNTSNKLLFHFFIHHKNSPFLTKCRLSLQHLGLFPMRTS